MKISSAKFQFNRQNGFKNLFKSNLVITDPKALWPPFFVFRIAWNETTINGSILAIFGSNGYAFAPLDKKHSFIPQPTVTIIPSDSLF